MGIFITLLRVGFNPSFWTAFLEVLGVGFFVGLPVSILIAPIIKKLADKVTCE
jgi:hypothetical protein